MKSVIIEQKYLEENAAKKKRKGHFLSIYAHTSNVAQGTSRHVRRHTHANANTNASEQAVDGVNAMA